MKLPHSRILQPMQNQANQERRLQTAAALLLGAAALVVIVLRSGMHRIFLPGWWRF